MYKWNMGGTPKELYDTGVTVSMEERKATIGDYLKSEKVILLTVILRIQVRI